MRIEEGKFYRTRGGRKVGPIEASDNKVYVWTDGEMAWTRDGHFYRASMPSGYDLTAEWTDEPATNDNSPIRTVARREIVPGRYGIVSVSRAQDGRLLFDLWKANASAAELREAAHLFNQIAEVLEEQASQAGAAA